MQLYRACVGMMQALFFSVILSPLRADASFVVLGICKVSHRSCGFDGKSVLLVGFDLRLARSLQLKRMVLDLCKESARFA